MKEKKELKKSVSSFHKRKNEDPAEDPFAIESVDFSRMENVGGKAGIEAHVSRFFCIDRSIGSLPIQSVYPFHFLSSPTVYPAILFPTPLIPLCTIQQPSLRNLPTRYSSCSTTDLGIHSNCSHQFVKMLVQLYTHKSSRVSTQALLAKCGHDSPPSRSSAVA